MRISELVSAEKSAKRNSPIFHFDSVDGTALATVLTLLDLSEAHKPIELGKGRAILYHPAHVKPGQPHLHFTVKGQKVAAINLDGTAHDQSHGIRLQRWALDGLKAHFPHFNRLEDGLIEHFMVTAGEVSVFESYLLKRL